MKYALSAIYCIFTYSWLVLLSLLQFSSYHLIFFFFSCIRRHTRYIGDWSSDVCSSDLITVAYPELHKVHERLVALDAVVDGEIIAMVDGVPSFEALQSRIHVRNERDIQRLSHQVPVSYVAFDLLYLDGRCLVDLPYTERRRRLEETIVPTGTVQLSTSVVGRGIAMYEAAKARNLEGIVAKRLASTYELGRRSQSWLKVKTSHEADLVIGGSSPGQR